MVEKSINIPIDDARLKDVAEVLGNKSCLKILDLLSEKDASVSDISGELEIPINTADYNVKKLAKAGLIEKASQWWSVKGKKIPVYRVSNKKIVISPKKVSRNFVAGILTAALTGIGALFIRGLTASKDLIVPKGEMLMAASERAVEDSVTSGGAQAVAPSVVAGGLPAWQWFLVGAWAGVVLFFLVTLLINKLKGESKIHHGN